jgi:hypothetical protein
MTIKPTPRTRYLSFVGWVDGLWVEGETGVGQEPDHQAIVVADPPDARFGGVGDLGQGGGWKVGQLDILEVAHRYSTALSSTPSSRS